MRLRPDQLAKLLINNPDVELEQGAGSRLHGSHQEEDEPVKNVSRETHWSEHDMQAAVFVWAAAAQQEFPELEWLYAIPNGGWRHPATGARLKAEGVKAGVPDVCLPVPRGSYHGLYIEMKRPDGRLSKDQVRWLEYLDNAGYCAKVCYSLSEAITTILEYLEKH